MGSVTTHSKWSIASIVGMSCLIAGMPLGPFGMSVAKAQTAGADSTHADSVQSPRSGHQCYDLATEQPEPLSEFRTVLLDAATAIARQAATPGERADALVELSRSYACLGQPELAVSLAEESLPIVEGLTDVSMKGRLLGAIANIYGAQLNNSAKANSLLLQLIELTKAGTAEDPALRYQLSHRIVNTYAAMGQYADVRRYIDSIEDISQRESALQMARYTLTNSEADDDSIRELFPEFTAERELSEAGMSSVYSLLSSVLSRDTDFDSSLPIQQQVTDELVNELTEAEVERLELVEDDDARVYDYINFAANLFGLGYSERAVLVLEKAVASLEELQDTESLGGAASVDVNRSMLYGAIADMFFHIGETDKGLALLEKMDNSPGGSMARASILLQVIFSLDRSTQQPQMRSLIVEAEQAARSSGHLSGQIGAYLTQIAHAYRHIGDTDHAQRIKQELLAEFKRNNNSFDGYAAQGLVYLLSSLGDYEEAITTASLVNEDEVYSTLAVDLAASMKRDLAQRVFSAIASPVQRIQTLIAMVEKYHYLEQSDTAFALLAQALDLAQTADLAEDEASFGYYENYDGSEDSSEALALWRRELVNSVLYSANELEVSTRLLPLIKDDSIRVEFMLDSADLETALAEEEDILARSLDDSVLRKIASKAAKEQMFFLAIEAVATVSSAYEQAKILTTIADCHTTNETTVDTETIQLIENLVDGYR